MAKSDVLDLVRDLSLSQADPVLIDHYYYDIINGLGVSGEILTSLELIEIAADTATHPLPANAVKLIGAFYGDSFLNEASVQEVESFSGAGWQSVKREPLAFVLDRENERNFRLFPTPVEPSAPFDFAFGEPLGHDYPENAVAVVMTDRRDNLPEWLELPVAFEILAREYDRESDHQDKEFAVTCRGAASLFFEMVL